MRLLLVNPPLFAFKPRFKTYATFPNGILYMASVLEKHGHKVQIYDNVIDSREAKDFLPFKPDIVGFSVVTGPHIEAAITQSKEFKRLLPGVKIVWGGAHPSILPEQTLAEPYIDYVVIGAGEDTLLELAQYLEKGNTTRLSEIKGLAYKENGQININEPRPFIKNLDELPDPAWHLVDVTKYWDITLNTSRGCPFRCTFCYNTAFHKGYRADFSAQRIVSQIEHLKKHYRVKYIKLWEDNFAFDNKKLRQFCHLIADKKLKVKWDCEARANLDEEDIALMAESGCVSVGLGMESGSQRILDFLKKGTIVREMERTFWLLVKHKILPRLYILYGLPQETAEDFKMTLELIRRLDYPPYTLGRFVPYPGTALFHYCVTRGLITPPERLGDWANFTTVAATKINLSEVPQQMIDEEAASFRKKYAIRPLRFAFKHNKAYFLRAMANPFMFLKALRNLIKYYLMVLFSSSNSLKAKASPKSPKIKTGTRI